MRSGEREKVPLVRIRGVRGGKREIVPLLKRCPRMMPAGPIAVRARERCAPPPAAPRRPLRRLRPHRAAPGAAPAMLRGHPLRRPAHRAARPLLPTPLPYPSPPACRPRQPYAVRRLRLLQRLAGGRGLAGVGRGRGHIPRRLHRQRYANRMGGVPALVLPARHHQQPPAQQQGGRHRQPCCPAAAQSATASSSTQPPATTVTGTTTTAPPCDADANTTV